MASTPGVEKSSTGLDVNIAALLAYLGSIVTGIIFFVIEKESRFVRFHAMQSIITGIALIAAWILLAVVSAVLSVVPFLGFLIGVVLWMALCLIGLGLWLLLMYKAYQGEYYKLPYIGDLAEQQLSKMS